MILFVKDMKKAIETKEDMIHAYVVNQGMKEIELHLGNLTDDEREIILKGCLINYNKKNQFFGEDFYVPHMGKNIQRQSFSS